MPSDQPSRHKTQVAWRSEGDFLSGRYARRHDISFDGGVVVTGSASPDVVPLPYALAEAVDPEEMFVASLSACHMLWFLDLCRRAGFAAASYVDQAEGLLEPGENGRLQITEVSLRPCVAFQGPAPTSAALLELHEAAHGQCFLAASTRARIRIEPQPSYGSA